MIATWVGSGVAFGQAVPVTLAALAKHVAPGQNAEPLVVAVTLAVGVAGLVIAVTGAPALRGAASGHR